MEKSLWFSSRNELSVLGIPRLRRQISHQKLVRLMSTDINVHAVSCVQYYLGVRGISLIPFLNILAKPPQEKPIYQLSCPCALHSRKEISFIGAFDP